MKFGSFVIKLVALNDASLPVSHGRLLHAAFLDLVRQADGELSEKLHDSNVKAFTTGTLSILHPCMCNGKIMIKDRQVVEWRLTSLETNLTNLLDKHKLKGQIRIGRGLFEIVEIYGSSPIKGLPSVLDMSTIIKYASLLCHNDSLTFKFMTPTSFRYYDLDYPFPRPDLIFGSLVEKWNVFTDDVAFDVEGIKQITAQYLIPIQWKGESCRVNITDKKGVTGFIGTYMFSLRQFPVEHRQVIFTLALFAMYSGIGRLNAQGMGKVKLVLE